MIITKEQLRYVKAAPNSCYDLIKPVFLFHSNKLEGSTFTLEELKKLVDTGTVSGEHSIDDVLETIGSVKVFDYLADTLDSKLSEPMLFEMNRLLFEGTSKEQDGFTGHWKQLANRIKGSRVQVVLPSDVPKVMPEIIDMMNRRCSFDEIAWLHARFEQIHPFQDGNGRIGRFIMLRQCVLSDVDIIAIDEEFGREYKTWLEIAQADGDFTYYCACLRECQKRFDEKMEKSAVKAMMPTQAEAKGFCARRGISSYVDSRNRVVDRDRKRDSEAR